MALKTEAPPPATPALGPGDSDGKPNKGAPEVAASPLRPGDSARKKIPAPGLPATPPLGPGDSARKKVATPGAVTRPLAPGDSDGKNPDDGKFEVLATSPPGPGSPASSPRQVVRIPKRRSSD